MTSQRVIGSYFVIAGLYTLAAALIWGVNTLFLLAAGLDIFGVFIANAAFTAGMVVFEIPTVLLRSLGERTDIIVGKRAGRRATCAAQGLPQVAQVDAIARETAG